MNRAQLDSSITNGLGSYMINSQKLLAEVAKIHLGDHGRKKRSIENSQEVRWGEVANVVVDICKHSNFDYILNRVEQIYSDDNKPTTLGDDDTFPVQIRINSTTRPTPCGVNCINGPKTCRCYRPLTGRSMALTPKGRDQLLQLGFDGKLDSGFFTHEQHDFFKSKGYVVKHSTLDNTESKICSDISPSETSSIRWENEGCIWLPFPMISIISATFTYHLVQSRLKYGVSFQHDPSYLNDFIIRGGEFYIQSIVIAAIEWLSAHGVRRAKVGAPSSVHDVVKAYLEKDTLFKRPDWVANIRDGRYTDSIPASNYGIEDDGIDFFKYGSDMLDKQVISIQKIDKSYLRSVKQLSPFIERKVGTLSLTESCSTSACARRIFHCISLSIHYSNFSDIKGMASLFSGISVFLGKRPGTRGKALTKGVFHWARVFGASPRFFSNVPVNIPVIESDLSDITTTGCSFTDLQSKKILEYLLSDRRVCTFEELYMLSLDKAPDELRPGLSILWDNYKSVDSGCGVNGDKFIRILGFMLGPAVIDGFKRGSNAGVAVTSYASDTVKKFQQGPIVDGKRTGMFCADSPSADYSIVFENMVEVCRDVYKSEPITLESMKRDLISVMTGNSGGADKVVMKLPVKDILGTPVKPGAERFERLSTNIKSATIPLLGDTLLPPNLFQILASCMITGVIVAVILFRYTAGRAVRIVYGTPIVQQGIQVQLYNAFNRVMKAETLAANSKSDGAVSFQPFRSTGALVHDFIDCIRWTCEIALDPHQMHAVIGEDANSLDQHISNQDRKAMIDAAMYVHNERGCVDGLSPPISMGGIGGTYMQLVAALLKVRDGWWFKINVQGSSDQVLFVNTTTSGDLITTVGNGLKMKSLQKFLELPAIIGDYYYPAVIPEKTHIQGDDVTAKIAVSPNNIVDYLKARTTLAYKCNQAMETMEKSWSGAVAHFLQILFICGQSVTRPMTIDYEHQSTATIKDLGSHIDKLVKVCSRGGNLETSTQWVLVYCVLGSVETIFGETIIYSPATLFQSGGALNRIIVGSPSSNGKGWLSANGALLNHVNVVDNLPIVIAPYDLGSRSLSKNLDKPVTLQVLGQRYTDNIENRLIKSSLAFLDLNKRRPSPAVSLTPTYINILKGMNPRFRYENSVRNTFYIGVGTWLLNRSTLTRQLKHESRLGAPPMTSSQVATRSLDMSLYIVGRPTTMSLSFSGDFYITRGDDGSFNVFRVNERISVSIIKPRWHPFLQQPIPVQLFLSIFGVSSKTTILGSSKDVMSRFTPHHRKDLNAKDVAHELYSVKDPTARMFYALAMGFTADEYVAMSDAIDQLPLLEHLSDAEDYGSMTDAVRCVSQITVMDALCKWGLDDATRNSYQDYPMSTKAVLTSLWAASLYEEINCHSCFPQYFNNQIIICRLPIISLVRTL